MEKCTKCKRNAIIICKHCTGDFCSYHIQMFDHSCPGTDTEIKNSRIELEKRLGKPIVSSRGLEAIR
jgi:predicted nucleic acid binding AN1-type Zn finger protein